MMQFKYWADVGQKRNLGQADVANTHRNSTVGWRTVLDMPNLSAIPSSKHESTDDVSLIRANYEEFGKGIGLAN